MSRDVEHSSADASDSLRADRDRRSQGGWWAAIAAWLVALPILLFLLLLEWGLARDYGTQDVGQYLLVLPAMLLVGVAAWLTLQAAGLRRWAAAGAGIAALAVLGAAFASVSWGDAARDDAAAAACSVTDLQVLTTLPMYEQAGAPAQGYPDGGCYLRYPVEGDRAQATDVLTSQLAADGWAVGSAGMGADPTIYVRDGIELYADVEGAGNLEEIGTTEGMTVFRLTLFLPER